MQTAVTRTDRRLWLWSPPSVLCAVHCVLFCVVPLSLQSAADELAWEVEGGAAAAMLAWKYACLAAADTAGAQG